MYRPEYQSVETNKKKIGQYTDLNFHPETWTQASELSIFNGIVWLKYWSVADIEYLNMKMIPDHSIQCPGQSLTWAINLQGPVPLCVRGVWDAPAWEDCE